MTCALCGADGANAGSYREAAPGTFILSDSGKVVTWVNRQGEIFCSHTHRRQSGIAAKLQLWASLRDGPPTEEKPR